MSVVTTMTTVNQVSLCQKACRLSRLLIYRTAEINTNQRTPRFNDAPIGRISQHFTGRESELETILSAIQSSNTGEPARFAIYGMPGLGKSQLALQLAKLAYTRGSYACIFWISATTVEKLAHGLVKVLYLVGDDSRNCSEQAMQLTASRRWLEVSMSSWLLVLDDATIDVIPFLREHLPRENTCGAIIITTRTCQVAEAIAHTTGQSVLELKPLSEIESAALLVKASGLEAPSNSSDYESAEKLVKQLGCLPLAVEQAGAYMKQKHIPAQELQALYAENTLHNVSLCGLYN